MRKMAAELLCALLSVDVEIRDVDGPDHGADALFCSAKGNFIIQFKSRADRGSVLLGIRQLALGSKQLAHSRLNDPWIPLLVVPYVGPETERLCNEAGVNWLDLSGNARIETDRLMIRVSGQPNRFVRRGRPSSAFAPKSARVARWMLAHPFQYFSQRTIAETIDLSEAMTGKVVKRLEEMALLDRAPSGEVAAIDPLTLLLAWREAADFSKNQLIKGHVPGRSSDQVLTRVADALRHAKVKHAATGLSAAWRIAPFASYRTVSIYVDNMPKVESLNAMGFREDEAGANCWLVVPKDEGVFFENRVIDGVNCVHPVQAYIDLKDHPERSAEAAERVLEILATEYQREEHTINR